MAFTKDATTQHKSGNNPMITPHQIDLFNQLRDKPTILTRVLQLKLAGMTHQQIANELGRSKSYIDNLHSLAKRQYQATL